MEASSSPDMKITRPKVRQQRPVGKGFLGLTGRTSCSCEETSSLVRGRVRVDNKSQLSVEAVVSSGSFRMVLHGILLKSTKFYFQFK